MVVSLSEIGARSQSHRQWSLMAAQRFSGRIVEVAQMVVVIVEIKTTSIGGTSCRVDRDIGKALLSRSTDAAFTLTTGSTLIHSPAI